MDKLKRKVEAELQDSRDQVQEKRVQLEELQTQLSKREEELTNALTRYEFIVPF